MRLPNTLLPLLACGGCLIRDIDRHIDQLQCSGSTTGTSTGTDTDSTGCPDSTAGIETTTEATSADTTTGTTTTAGTDSDSADATSSTNTISTDTSSSTGEPVAVCGNGIIENFGPEPEDCDDANDIPDDGCSDCGRDRMVFITSADYQAFIFMGLVGADQRCRSLSQMQGLPNFAGFKAWLSDSKVSARDRMFHGRGRYVLINGLVVADNWDALVSGQLQNRINVTELSETKNYLVWTGTLPDGSGAVGADYCADWSGSLDENRAHWGRSGEISSEWTIADSPVDQPSDCISELALYCFEQN